MERQGVDITTLHRSLQMLDIGVSRHTVFRLARKAPQRLSLHLLVGICEVLECTPSDLIQLREPEGPKDAPLPPTFRLRVGT